MFNFFIKFYLITYYFQNKSKNSIIIYHIKLLILMKIITK